MHQAGLIFWSEEFWFAVGVVMTALYVYVLALNFALYFLQLEQVRVD